MAAAASGTLNRLSVYASSRADSPPMSFCTCWSALHIDWLNARSVVALGMMTAILIGFAAAAVGASVAAGADVAAGALVGAASVGAGVAGAPQAARTTISIPMISKFLNFIFILLLESSCSHCTCRIRSNYSEINREARSG